MFPLQLLALLFISTLRHESGGERRQEEQQEEQEQAEEEAQSKYDLVFRRGDLLEVPRTLFTHFGIYLGRGRVVHFIPDIMPVVSSDPSRVKQMVTNSRLLLGALAKRGSIRTDSVEDFAYGAEILVNTMDQVCSRPALSGEEVARRAEKLQGDMSYSLLWYNCEHFVMYCRYGAVTSFQTFQFCKSVRKLLLSWRVAMATAALAVTLVLFQGAVTSCGLLAALLPCVLWMAS